MVRSISPEEGRTLTLVLGASGREVGSDYKLLRARANATQYLRVPATRHVVLVLNAGGGVADGTIGGRAPFELGGATAPDPLALLPGTVSAPSSQLRGYPVGALAGTGFVVGNLELRFPLADPTRGRSTWPVFLRRVHGALFLDGGDAFDLPRQVAIAGHELSEKQLRFSTGAELRLEVVLGYYIRTDIRLGVARPLGALFGNGRAQDRAYGIDLPQVAWYISLGSTY
jgi:outer membrane protein assembly factor BamA